jgi:hypothetical protein
MNTASLPLTAVWQVGGEGQPAGVLVACDHGVEAGLEDRDPPASSMSILRLVLVDADDVEAEFGKAGTGHETDIAGADHGDSHLGISVGGRRRGAGNLVVVRRAGVRAGP